jgi:hypothetical protein
MNDWLKKLKVGDSVGYGRFFKNGEPITSVNIREIEFITEDSIYLKDDGKRPRPICIEDGKQIFNKDQYVGICPLNKVPEDDIIKHNKYVKNKIYSKPSPKKV